MNYLNFFSGGFLSKIGFWGSTLYKSFFHLFRSNGVQKGKKSPLEKTSEPT